jgi:hypothetical protein
MNAMKDSTFSTVDHTAILESDNANAAQAEKYPGE